MARGKASVPRHNGRVRIIGGRWRGRRIGFPEAPALRPTPDRVRETVFNWLAPHLDSARVLDLFAGSGALGFEALSRGAASVVAVERDRRVAGYLRSNAEALDAAGFKVVVSDAGAFLDHAPRAAFDLVFVDPPHTGTDYEALCERLEASAVLAAQASVYVELSRHRMHPFTPPPAWQCARSGQAGDVTYQLWRRDSPVVD